MTRQLILAIAESAESLEKQLKSSRTASQKERLQMLWWLKTGQITQHKTLAERLGRDGSTVTRWLQKYRQGGLSELLVVKSAPGKSPHLSEEAIAGLQKRLEQPPGFKSYGEIVEWLNQTYQLNLTYPTVYHWVHYRLKAKLKVPRPSGVQTLSLLEAKIATFINDGEDNLPHQPLSSSSVEGDCKLSICRLPASSISQLRQIGRETDCELVIKDCICIGETQDFYHGCLAAIDFALSLAGEKYAYAQISLVKTNAANFIELNNDWERRVLELKGLSSSKRQDGQPKQNLLVWLSQADGDNQVGMLGSEAEGDEADLRSTEAGALAEIQEQDLKSERSDYSELIVPLALSNSAILKDQNESPEGVREQFTEEVVKLEKEERLELENLLSRALLDSYQQLKLGKCKVIEDWTAFLESGEAIRVISDRDSHIVLRITLEGEVQSALSYGDAEVLGAIVKENSEDLGIFSNWLEPIIPNPSGGDLNADLVPPAATMDIQQVKMAESILPTAQRAFEYLLDRDPDRVEETDEYTRVRVGDLYDLIVGELEGVSVSSLTVSVRGELIKVRGEKLVLAQGISPEDIDFWTVVADELDRIEARSRDWERSEPDSQSSFQR